MGGRCRGTVGVGGEIMSAAGCEQAFELHSHMLEQHDKALAQFASIPEIINGLKFSLDRLNDTIDRLEEKAQTQMACKATHAALDALRVEQLGTVRDTIQSQGKSIFALEKKVDSNEKEIDELRGAVRFLKWAIPVLVSISVACAKLIN